MITKLTYLALNKIDHLNYWLELQQFAPVDTLMDIGCGNHPQDFIKVTGRHYTVDPKSAMVDARYFHVPGTWQLQALDILKHYYVHTVVLMDVVEQLEGDGMSDMTVSVLVTCQNCDYWHSGYCDLGMRKKRSVGKGKLVNGVMQGKHLVCRKFSVFFKQPYAGYQYDV